MRMQDLRVTRTIAARLIAFSALYAVASIVVASIMLWFILANIVREQVDQRLDLQLEALRGALAVNADGALALNSRPNGPPFDRLGSGWYWQVSDGRDKLSSPSLGQSTIDSPPKPFDWRRLLFGGPQAADGSAGKSEPLHFRTLQTIIDGKPVEIFATAPRAALSVPAIRALTLLIPAMVSLGVLLLAGVFFQVRFGLKPLRLLTTQIAEISAGRSAKLPDPTADELLPVTVEINRLVEVSRKRLEDTRLQFANLAHGLKTPVASLYLALASTDRSDDETRRLVEQIDRRIRHHLARARGGLSEAGVASPTALQPRLDDILHMMAKLYAEKAIDVQCEIDASTVVNCSPEDTEEIFGSIIDNAFKWTNSVVRVSTVRARDAVITTIEDDGPGILDKEIEEALKPGRRLDETVPGDGFGLSIAKELAELYGGGLVVGKGSTGTGLAVSVSLPA